MATDPDGKDELEFDLPEGLDDDLGDDWESAFQAEDFMFSPDEESDDFFLNEDGSGTDMDLTSLMATSSTRSQTTSQQVSGGEGKEEADRQEEKSPFAPAAALAAFAGAVAHWFRSRSPAQKILIPALLVLPFVIFAATRFFQSTTEQLARQQTPPPVSETAPSEAPPSVETGKQAARTAAKPPAPPKPEPLPAKTVAEKIRKKWPMPSFLITAGNGTDTEPVLVKIDVTLVTLLQPGERVPQDKEAIVRDAIYQFYINRPAEELRRFALARGEMIRKLESWLRKQFPAPPIASIIFNRYEILR